MSSVDSRFLQATETVVGRSLRAVVLENDLLSTTVLLDLGADIHTLIYKPRGIDALWKSPLSFREPGVGPTPAGDSLVLWRTYYRGGWQVLLPNFGQATEYKGTPLDVHGEAARTVWQLERIESDGNTLQVVMAVALLKSPFRIRRTLTLQVGDPSLAMQETVTNEAPEMVECMWGHHPAFGAPLLSAQTVLDTGARLLEADDDYDQPGNDIPPGQPGDWPWIQNREGKSIDLSLLPAPSSRLTRAIYLKDFDQGWFALTNQDLRLGVGIVWDRTLFPCINEFVSQQRVGG